MSARNIRLAAAFAATLVAGTAHAQWWKSKQKNPPPQQTPAQTQPGQPAGQTPPAQTPAAQPGQTPQADQPTSTGHKPTRDELQTYGSLHLRNAFLVESGMLAQQRGSSQQVKDLGRRLESEHRRTDVELAGLMRERGLDIAKVAMPEHERAQHQQRMSRLQSLSGDEFDRQFTQLAIEVTTPYVDDLKSMRNRTPGSDARLKKWLDDTENVAEDDLTAARKTKVALDSSRSQSSQQQQRAARRPAPAPGR